MKKIVEYLIAFVFKIALFFRYRIKVKGLDKLTPETLSKSGGVLFLPNHPAYFVDPISATLATWPKFPIRPMVVEYMYYTPFVHAVMKYVKALPIPDFVASSNSLKRKKGENVIGSLIEGLKNKENFLLYPAGKVKHTAYEAIGGSSAVHRILQEAPESNVVLVRIKGLWGSRFSRAITTSAPSLPSVMWDAVKIILKNLIFFTPRREITIELVPAPADFPYGASRLEMNRYLERWYNLPDGLTKQTGEYPGDSLVLVSYSMWGDDFLPLHEVKENLDKDLTVNQIPQDIQNKVVKKLAELSDLKSDAIRPEMALSADLGLDSLDAAELVVFLQDQFDISGVPVSELTTVLKLMAIASRNVICETKVEEVKCDLTKWRAKGPRKRAEIAPGETIAEVFLNECKRKGSAPACADARAGIQTYSKLKLRVILIAEYIRHLPGTYVGILLPSSVAANVVILACELAGKIPLMINWTIGPRHLESVVKLTDVKVVLSSWAFLDRLESVDLDGLDDRLVMLEDVVREFTLTDKIKAAMRSKYSVKSILKTFGADKIKKNDPAVLLFTSGTESMPKGVPLSHENILTNQRAVLAVEELFSDDVIFAILPPFHSFGFTVTGILGILSGIRIAYSPDPTDGPRLAKEFAFWESTVMCGAPTFLKGILKAAAPDQLKTMRLCVSGAEKAPPELFQMLANFGKPECLAEGYGITECSPILTANLPGQTQGVGKPIPGVELCIIHPETEEVLPTGHRGMILARGSNVFSGYINPGLSSPFITIQGKEWYRTGDLGYIDQDGCLTISGRLKRFIKIGGEMVSLAALEDALLQIADKKGWPLNHEGPSFAICAKENPDEKPKIFLFSRFDIPLEEVNKALKEAGFTNLVKVSAVTQLAEIPIMGTGKVNYRILESQYLTNA